MIHKIFIFAAIVYIGISSTIYATQIDDFVKEYGTKTAEERVEVLGKIIESSTDRSDNDVALLLLTDAKYEIVKRRIASQMLDLAESRTKGLADATLTNFSHSAKVYDALSILQSIPIEWLSSSERERALSLSNELVGTLNIRVPQQENSSNITTTNQVTDQIDIDDSIKMVNKAVEAVLNEDLSIVAEAVPNKVIRMSLDQCEDVRENLMSLSPDVTNTSRLRWENAMEHLSNSVTFIKERQQIKYTLWAEGVYRETDPTQVGKKITEKEAMMFYKRLSEVNVAMVSEPSLAREITKRLYDLYDLVNTTESKAYIRYAAIINLDKRKALDDF